MPQTNFLNTGYFYEKLYQLLTGQAFFGDHSIISALKYFLSAITPLAIFLSLIFLVGIAYSASGLRKIKQKVHEQLHEAVSEPILREEAKNERWLRIIDHLSSENQSDWRLAILECDIILDEMLEKMGYHGETISDKLKTVERSDFNSIDKAWEGHRVRNAIAHEGSSFQITQQEAQRVAGLYEDVFREFHYI